MTTTIAPPKTSRMTADEALCLLKLTDEEEIEAVCRLADERRKLAVGDTVTFASTIMLYPTNLCELNCQFCSFYAKPGWKKAWFNTPAQVEERIRPHVGKADRSAYCGRPLARLQPRLL